MKKFWFLSSDRLIHWKFPKYCLHYFWQTFAIISHSKFIMVLPKLVGSLLNVLTRLGIGLVVILVLVLRISTIAVYSSGWIVSVFIVIVLVVLSIVLNLVMVEVLDVASVIEVLIVVEGLIFLFILSLVLDVVFDMVLGNELKVGNIFGYYHKNKYNTTKTKLLKGRIWIIMLL